MSVNQNGTVWADGALREWTEVSVPLMSDAIMRSVAVFEGMRADRRDDGRIRLLCGAAHVQRLYASARALRLTLRWTPEQILSAAATVAAAELDATGGRIAYVRPMLLGAAVTGDGGPHSLTIAAFVQDDTEPAPIRAQISALRRPEADQLPPQIKAIANYQLTRLARLTAKAAGYHDALLLNRQGRLAEAAGAAVLVEHGGRVLTPPEWEGCLRSITVDAIERIAAEAGIPFAREPIPLATLTAADGVALAGTLADLVEVSAVDDLAISGGSQIAALRRHYRDGLNGGAYAKLLDFDEF
ncbi:branched chain amino acid aminotransferase [Actinoplanes cyaneus]|uniref:Branched chain amino acid aminotransferase n=1 Tax=Actinoplanes cyaneus TaxID=52696 RepID=A0A919M603_9ACTN|nr:aminotransferase class IV [Actinoplanes cyaneus]MCW2144272.1 branched chain amino acid aminotransferase apoenzyme [Actinoplanes cyaneus]GID71015.1 branched chain amino acid aminotransferase [Actinoplanes cyaneus]